MTEIKISELSIGDWVFIDNTMDKSIGKIARIHYDSALVDCGEGHYLGGYISQIEPILLTPEILEKNGFDAPKAKVWNDSWYWSNRKDVALELRESFGLWYMEIVTKEQRSGLQSNRKLGIGFNYVHQLQHALRLAGVEKEIEV